MWLIRVGIFCFSFGSRVLKRFPVCPLWPEESKLSIWEMQAWPYSLSFLSWKMSTKKSTKACSIKLSKPAAFHLQGQIWDGILWLSITDTFLPRQLETVGQYFPLCLVCILVLTGPLPPASLWGSSPNLAMHPGFGWQTQQVSWEQHESQS